MDGNTLQEFWSVKVGHAGAKAELEETDGYIHFSNIVLGEGSKPKEPVVLKMQTEDTETVLCTLEQGRVDQVFVDLTIDSDAKLTHNSASANIYINGYKIILIDELMNKVNEEEEEEEEPVLTTNGKITNKLPNTSANKAIAQAAGKMEQDSEDEDDDEDDDDEEDGVAPPHHLIKGKGGAKFTPQADDDDEDDEDDEEDSEEEDEPSPPPKASAQKKRPMEAPKGMSGKKQKVGGGGSPAGFAAKSGIGKGKQAKKMGKQGRR